MGRLIPYGKHFIDSDDVEVVSKTLRSGTLTQGPNVSLFEESIAKYTGAKHAVAVSSATAGLHLAYLAAGLVPKKFILTSPITFVSTANASLFCGGSVEFADIDRDTINIGYENVKKALESNTDIQIVVPVLFGGSADGVPETSQLAKSYGKFVVEDAAHGLGGSYQCGAKIGSCRYSDATVFSLHPVKSIAAGEGGVVTTNDSGLYEKLISLRSHGITREIAKFKQTDLVKTDQKINLWYYEMQRLGYHYRLTDIQASLANSQLQKLDKFIVKRREIAAKYIRFLENFQFIKPAQKIDINLSANHLFIAEFDLTSLNIRRNDIMEQLRLNNIITQVHYIPVPIQSYYQKIGMRGDNLPNSMAYYERCLSLPIYYDLSDDDLTLVFENLRNIETKKQTMNNVYIKPYNELSPDEIQTFRNSRIYRDLQDHYIFNELSELYYRQYFENKKTNNSQILFSNRDIVALLPSLAEPHFLEFAGMPTEFFSRTTGLRNEISYRSS